MLLLQELKGTEFPAEAFKSLGYESVAVTQKAYNGVAILSRHPMTTIAKALGGDDSDSHARFLAFSHVVTGFRRERTEFKFQLATLNIHPHF